MAELSDRYGARTRTLQAHFEKHGIETSDFIVDAPSIVIRASQPNDLCYRSLLSFLRPSRSVASDDAGEISIDGAQS